MEWLRKLEQQLHEGLPLHVLELVIQQWMRHQAQQRRLGEQLYLRVHYHCWNWGCYNSGHVDCPAGLGFSP